MYLNDDSADCGVRARAAESLLLNKQFIVSKRSRQRAPNLTTLDRSVLGLITLLASPRRIPRLSRTVKSAALFKFCQALIGRMCRILFCSAGHARKPGPKRPSAELIGAIVELKRRNPKPGCVRIAGILTPDGTTPATYHELRSPGILRLYQGYGPQALAGHKDAVTFAIHKDKRGAEWVDAAA
jgi:hypothetical protein